LTGFGDYDGAGCLNSILPANYVAGTARIDGRTVLLGADDSPQAAGPAMRRSTPSRSSRNAG